MSKSTTEIRKMFLNFFHSKEHQIVASSSLVPENDKTLLFTNAGMNQFKDVFLGIDSRPYQRAVTSQHCVRAGGKHNDLENVGYTSRHHTFFEMLGNFSFGDYFKQEAIQFSWELLTSTQWFNLDKEKLWVTVHTSDDESYNIWTKKIDISEEHVIRIGDNKDGAYISDNFWQMSDIGPCGPCSEIFYDQGEHIMGGPPGSLEENGDRYIEIWNLVFIQFNRRADGTLFLLSKPSVDTGMGLERIAAVLQYVNSNYDIDLFKTLIIAIAQVIGIKDLSSRSLCVIADHIRSCAFLISDGVIPSNEGRGYVLRRIIRRAIRHGNILGAQNTFFYKLVIPLIKIMGNYNNRLQQQQLIVEQILRAEEERFSCTLKRGLTLLDNELAKLSGNTLDGETAFYLYDTYGFPFDLTADICRERNLYVEKAGFEYAMTMQRKRSRKSSRFNVKDNTLIYNIIDRKTRFFGYEELEHQGQIIALFQNNQTVESINQNEEATVVLDETPFYGESGGQVGDRGKLESISGTFKVSDTQKYGEIFVHFGKLVHGELKLNMQVIASVDKVRRKRICLNHSATHLLYASLRQVLGEHVKQKGSLVNDNYLRFDFSHDKAMKPEQIYLVNNIVNQQIRCNILITVDVINIDKTCNKDSLISVNNKYDTQVRVLNIGNFSTELCVGTHVCRTGDIGLFHIISESSNAKGIRRIEAITGEKALDSINQQSKLIHQATHILKSNNKTLIDKILMLQNRTHLLEKEIQKLKNEQAIQESILLIPSVYDINGVNILISQLKDNTEQQFLHMMIYNLKNQLNSAVVILITIVNNKVNLIVSVTEDLINRIKASDIVNHLVQQIGGKGGGNQFLAQAKDGSFLDLSSALISVNKMLTTVL